MRGLADCAAASARAAAEARAGGRYLAALVDFLRRPLDPRRARELIEAMRRGRERNFLAVLEHGVFAPGGVAPYRALLRNARLDLDQIVAWVDREGVEVTLERLFDAGVRLSLEEFKGRRPIVRPGLELEVCPEDFDNPLASGHISAQTGGSTARPRRIMIDLAEVTHEAAHLELLLEGLPTAISPQAAWFPPPPGVTGLKWALRHAKRGRPPERWFAQRPVSWRGAEAAFAALTAATWATGLLVGCRLPWPRHTPPADAILVAGWLEAQRRRGRPAMLRTYPSSAVRVCHAARRAGIDLSGTLFSLVGEPYTPAKHAAITAVGARAVCSYFITEAGQIGTGCSGERPVDDVHVMTDRVALAMRACEIEPGHQVDAILVSTLAPSAPKILINVETGDHGVLEQADCSCPTGALGFNAHLHTIRSYEKVVSEGMNFLGAELVEILEVELPARFGGGPTDYQLLEDEQDGISRLVLLVDPRVGPLDERAVADATISRLAARGVGHGMMADVWRVSDTLRVIRREPFTTPAGKIQPLGVSSSR